MKISEILRTIDDRIQVASQDYWAGVDGETQNEMIILAQRDGVQAAIEEIDAAAVPAGEAE